jgi:large repetitive protein
MSIKKILLLIFFYKASIGLAQQNCLNAIPICQNIYSQVNANIGIGNVADLSGANQGCLTNGEVNSSWYILSTSTAGTIQFSITPNVSTDDYDFAIWDITDTNCAALAAGLTPIKCNFASLANSNAGGVTGINTSGTVSSIGAAGPSISSAIIASVGQTFLLVVNNNSGTANGYSLNFSGSTAQIFDNVNPTIKSIYVPPSCGGPSSIRLNLNENITCASLSANGSEFSIGGGYSITNIAANNCGAGGLFTNSITLQFNTALAPGTYTINITNGIDGNTLIDNCGNSMVANTTYTFAVQAPVKINVAPQFGCSGSTSGSITASGTGGILPYKYKLNNGTYNVGNTFNALLAGTYTVYIKDSLGCVHDTIVNLAPAPPIVINSVSTTNLTCFNASNGSISISASGGNAPLTYAANSSAYSSSTLISGLSPGTYVVHTKDANGCIKDTIVLITSPGPIIGTTVNISNVSCLGQNNGSIQYVATGGNLPLQYALNTGVYTSFANYINLSAGSYTLHIKDANNCIVDTIINITQPSAVLNASIGSVVQPGCTGAIGSANIIANGGTSPYTYSINGTAFSSANAFSNLSSGTYTLYAKDAGGCVATAVATLVSPGNLSFNGAIVSNPTCIVNGSITVYGIGGTAPLSFANGLGSYSSSNTFTNLAAGTYTLHVKDNNNCIHDTIILLIPPSLPQLAISNQINVTCSSPNIGSISVNSSGGFGTKTYNINGGVFSSSSTFNNLTAGIYTIIVKDANGCTTSITSTITSINTVGFANTTITNVGCNASTLGSINVVGNGGIAAYTYQINGGAIQSSGVFNNLNAGTYTITTTDNMGCSKTTIAQVQSSGIFTIATYSNINATCSNPGNGSIAITMSGGIAPISFSINGSSNSIGLFNGLGPGTYTVIATDANGCTKSSTTIITGPPKLWFTNTTVVLPPCFGGIGSINTNGIGGAAPYTFSLNNGIYASNNSFNNLPAGTYTIKLKDANGCIHDTIINLIQPNPVLVNNTMVSNAACNGNATGSISIIGGGTAGPYTYNINNGSFGSSGTFSNLSAGSYTVNVKDVNGCTASSVISINNNGNFYFGTVGGNMPTCFGGNNGNITFTGSGGNAPYQYSINSGSYVGTNTFTNLSAATYTLTIKDANNCVVQSVANLNQPAAILFNSIILNAPLCYNGTTASATVNGSGGTGLLTYKIDAGAYTTNSTFSGLLFGTHTLSIKDANNCIKDTVVYIPNALPVGFSNFSIISPGCFGNGNGSITVGGNGGTAPFTFSINASTFSSNILYNGLNAGSYTIVVKDANNCTGSSTALLSNVSGVQITNIAITHPTCANLNNGVINITGNTSNPALSFGINGAGLQASSSFTNLGIGTFSVHVQDALGCYKDTIVTLINQSNLSINNVQLGATNCYGDSTGSAWLTAIGSSGTILYTINNLPYSTNNTFGSLTNTSYTLFAKDALGCIEDTIVNIPGPMPIYFSSSNITAPYCNGSQDGIISIGGGGGVAPYLYSINNFPFGTGNTFNNLIQGTYTFTIKDNNGCLHDTSIFLQGPDIVYFLAFAVTDITCFGASNGAIAATADGGLAPYQYKLNNNAFITTNTFSSLPVGTYTLTAKDNQGCLKDTIVNINAPISSVILQLTSIANIKCRGDSTGSIGFTGVGGLPPYSYAFINNSSYNSTNNYNNLKANNYLIFVKDANGCEYDTTIAINEPDSTLKIILTGKTSNSCVGVYDASISVSATNGYSPYYFTLNSLNKNTDTFYTNLFPGEYFVEVTDSIGCKSTGKYTIDSSLQIPSILLSNLINNICQYDVKGQVNITTINTYTPSIYYLNNDSIGSISTLTMLPSTNYTLQMIDAKGCKADTSFNISYIDSIKIETFNTDALCYGNGDDGKVSINVKDGPEPYIYNWSNGFDNTKNTIDPIGYGAYNIEVIDALGCKADTNFIIGYYPCCSIWLPNVFTPNNDGVNDDVVMKPGGPVKFESIEIYNRWGMQIFKSTDINSKWNGTYNGKICELDTYIYVVRYICETNGKKLIKKGDIILAK